MLAERQTPRLVCPDRAKLGYRSALFLCKLCDETRSSGGTGRGDGFVVIFPEPGTGWLRNMKRLVEIFAGHFSHVRQGQNGQLG
jgi:hypothetical protein